MVERIVLALIILAPALASADSGPTVSAQPAPAQQVEQIEPPAAAIPLAPPSMIAPRNPATSPPATGSQWYGWQILISDAAVFSFAGLTHNAGVAYGWVGSGAIVHWGHGNVGRGLASAALRVGLPRRPLPGRRERPRLPGRLVRPQRYGHRWADRYGGRRADRLRAARTRERAHPGRGPRGAAQPRCRGFACRARRSIRVGPRPRRPILIPGTCCRRERRTLRASAHRAGYARALAVDATGATQ